MDNRCQAAAKQARLAVALRRSVHPEGCSSASAVLQGAHDLYEDVLSCYFPLVFSPRPGDPDAVSRDALAEALLAALTATPAFAPMFLPLALEKLTSTLKYEASCAGSPIVGPLQVWGSWVPLHSGGYREHVLRWAVLHAPAILHSMRLDCTLVCGR